MTARRRAFSRSRLAGLLTGLLLVFAFAGPGAARAAGVAVVTADQLQPPAAEILAGFHQSLGETDPAEELTTYHLAADDPDGRKLVAAIRRQHPRVILVLGSQALRLVSTWVKDTPIVYGLVLSEQLVADAGNLTGVVLDFPVATQLDWLHRILPRAKTVGVIYHPAQNAVRIREAQQVARRLDLRLLTQPINTPRELPTALDALANHADVLWGLSDRMVINAETARSVLLFSFRNRLPFFGLSTAWVKAGALFSLERDYRDIGHQCADLTTAILHGQAPANLPPQSPRKVLYCLNRRTAEQMKVEFPASLWRQAKTVY